MRYLDYQSQSFGISLYADSKKLNIHEEDKNEKEMD